MKKQISSVSKETKELVLDLLERIKWERVDLKMGTIDISKPGDKWTSCKPGKRIVTIIEKMET